METLAHGSIRRDILVGGATAHSIPARKDLARRAVIVAFFIGVAGVSNRAVGGSGTCWNHRGRGAGRGGSSRGGTSDGAVPVAVVGAVRVLHAVRVARVQEVRVLLERGARAEEASAAAATAAGACASWLGRAGAEGQGRRLGRERDGAGSPAVAALPLCHGAAAAVAGNGSAAHLTVPDHLVGIVLVGVVGLRRPAVCKVHNPLLHPGGGGQGGIEAAEIRRQSSDRCGGVRGPLGGAVFHSDGVGHFQAVTRRIAGDPGRVGVGATDA